MFNDKEEIYAVVIAYNLAEDKTKHLITWLEVKTHFINYNGCQDCLERNITARGRMEQYLVKAFK